MKKKLIIPKFKNEDEERDFWSEIDLSEYFEPEDFKNARFPKLNKTRLISIRLPEELLEDVKKAAKKNDVPYQSFIKIILAERIQEEQIKARKVKKSK